MSEVYNTASAAHAPEEVRKFAKLISERQNCRVLLANEASGYHVYVPCPDCLVDHGKRELNEPKYSINVSKYLALGDGFKDLRDGDRTFDPIRLTRQMNNRETRDTRSGVCMRTKSAGKQAHMHSVRSLLDMRTVTERHPDLLTRAEVQGQAGASDREANWEIDPVSGISCPPPPGTVVPITQLSPSHPAADYLLRRGYDLHKLWEQFRCSYCVKEYPAGKNGIFYRKMPGGWKDTPQGRIIFYSLVKGAPMTWQARYPERISANGTARYMLHPYWEEHATAVYAQSAVSYPMWSLTHTRPHAGAAWIPVPPFDETNEDGTPKFQPSKYRTAKYSSRQMMGWDAALLRAERDPDYLKWVVLCEGPLDAARVGPGGVALIGSSISHENAALVASNFNIVFTAFDEDKAGRGATEKVGKMLMSSKQRAPVIQLVAPLPVTGGKDLGDMTQEAFETMFRRTRNKTNRGR